MLCLKENIQDENIAMAKRRLTVKALLELIHQREGICLSPLVGLTSRDRIDLQCKYDHTWTTQVKYVFFDRTWCPFCFDPKNPGFKSTKGTLKANCFNNHEWAPTEQEILTDAKCPQCKPKKAPRLSFLSCLGRLNYTSKS